MLGLKFINVDALVRGGRSVFSDKRKTTLVFCAFHKLAVLFYIAIGMSPAWDSHTDAQGEMWGPTAEGGNFCSRFTEAVISVQRAYWKH